MTDTPPNALSDGPVWPAWRKVAFRFAFIYLLLYTTPWSLPAGSIPWIGSVTQYYDRGWDWVVRFANAHWFNVADELVPFNGSGDTSFGFAQLWLMLIIGVVGAAIWTVIDNGRKNYQTLDYWTRVCVRYYIAYFCLSYGIIKLFAMQMWFPTLTQMATPLGDFLPMRLYWMFIGYSTPYQVFSGVMETLAGLLLINRKTVTLGLITATGVFIHVFVLNLSYDIPVKLFSAHLLLFCIYLLTYEMPRLINFFILNRVAEPDTFFKVEFASKWMRWGRIVSKIAFVVIAFGMQVYSSYGYYQSREAMSELKPIKEGVYDVDLYVKNNIDTVAPLVTDTLWWQEMIFQKGGGGSMKSADSAFSHRYGRAYFWYKPDTLKEVLEIRRFPGDSLPVASMKYEFPDDRTMLLRGKFKNDTLFVRLRRSKRHFQLAERQFHWLSEYNR